MDTLQIYYTFFSVDQYVTKLRRIEVDNSEFVDLNTKDEAMQQLPTVIGYIWDETHGQAGPMGWNPQLYWPWEDVRMLLTFLPARMKADKMRAVFSCTKLDFLPLSARFKKIS